VTLVPEAVARCVIGLILFYIFLQEHQSVTGIVASFPSSGCLVLNRNRHSFGLCVIQERQTQKQSSKNVIIKDNLNHHFPYSQSIFPRPILMLSSDLFCLPNSASQEVFPPKFFMRLSPLSYMSSPT